MRYFHIPISQISDNQVRISGRELHHLVNVLRLREGDEIAVLDGVGGIYKALLTSCGRDLAVGEIKAYRQAQLPYTKVTIYIGLPKPSKMDMIVQKATELGAYSIVPVLCQHTVPSVKQAQRRVARWRQIAVEASKQSRRPFFPFIPDILSFREALESCQADVKLIFVAHALRSQFFGWESRGLRSKGRHAASNRLRDVLEQNADARNVSIFIGPEGGFAEDEIRDALSVGALPVSLRGNILRTETAAIATLAIVLYEKDTDKG